MSTKAKRTSKKTKAVSAEEFDAKFDRGEDVSEHVDWDRAQKFVNVPFPAWMIEAMDEEANRLGINRQALIKVWISDCIERPRNRKGSGL